MMAPTCARAVLSRDGGLTVGAATADMGPGAYAVMTQIAADATGLPVERLAAELRDAELPFAPVEVGSFTAASTGSAVRKACESLLEDLFDQARRLEDGPLSGTHLDDIDFVEGRIVQRDDPATGLRFEQVLEAAGMDELEVKETARPGDFNMMKKARNTHSAVFVEVRVDEELGMARVASIVGAAAAIANAIFHATGKRVRDLPIAIDKLLRSMNSSPRHFRSQTRGRRHDPCPPDRLRPRAGRHARGRAERRR